MSQLDLCHSRPRPCLPDRRVRRASRIGRPRRCRRGCRPFVRLPPLLRPRPHLLQPRPHKSSRPHLWLQRPQNWLPTSPTRRPRLLARRLVVQRVRPADQSRLPRAAAVVPCRPQGGRSRRLRAAPGPQRQAPAQAVTASRLALAAQVFVPAVQPALDPVAVSLPELEDPAALDPAALPVPVQAAAATRHVPVAAPVAALAVVVPVATTALARAASVAHPARARAGAVVATSTSCSRSPWATTPTVMRPCQKAPSSSSVASQLRSSLPS